MKTEHRIHFGASQSLSRIQDNSVQLVVTSPPYPMIEMWDDVFSKQNSSISCAMSSNNTAVAFELMHQELDKVWAECFRVLSEGGFLCVNVGDATRTFNGDFQLFNNHSRITASCLKIGFKNLPNIIWHKPTNAPNKFMGSGMLPCGAYVTLEHEYILIFRKGDKRAFKTAKEKEQRRKSAFFWEERNSWFSDIWSFVGTKQQLDNKESRDRSAAFPLEVPYRLISMYSQAGDTILDPFYGIGTTTLAAIILERNSIGYEIDATLKPSISQRIASLEVPSVNAAILSRFKQHVSFVDDYTKRKGAMKHYNNYFKCGVVTSQEEAMELHFLSDIEACKGNDMIYRCSYEERSDMDNPPLRSTLFV